MTASTPMSGCGWSIPLTVRGWVQTVGSWGHATFGVRPLGGILAHLEQEVAELHDALMRYPRTARDEADVAAVQSHDSAAVAEEIADCLHLLFQIADVCQLDLQDALVRKHHINRARSWAAPDSDGVTHHIDGSPCAGRA